MNCIHYFIQEDCSGERKGTSNAFHVGHNIKNPPRACALLRAIFSRETERVINLAAKRRYDDHAYGIDLILDNILQPLHVRGPFPRWRKRSF
jgi:hypothetical protein